MEEGLALPVPTSWALSSPSPGTAEFPGSLKEEHLGLSGLWLQLEGESATTGVSPKALRIGGESLRLLFLGWWALVCAEFSGNKH